MINEILEIVISVLGGTGVGAAIIAWIKDKQVKAQQALKHLEENANTAKDILLSKLKTGITNLEIVCKEIESTVPDYAREIIIKLVNEIKSEEKVLESVK